MAFTRSLSFTISAFSFSFSSWSAWGHLKIVHPLQEFPFVSGNIRCYLASGPSLLYCKEQAPIQTERHMGVSFTVPFWDLCSRETTILGAPRLKITPRTSSNNLLLLQPSCHSSGLVVPQDSEKSTLQYLQVGGAGLPSSICILPQIRSLAFQLLQLLAAKLHRLAAPQEVLGKETLLADSSKGNCRSRLQAPERL